MSIYLKVAKFDKMQDFLYAVCLEFFFLGGWDISALVIGFVLCAIQTSIFFGKQNVIMIIKYFIQKHVFYRATLPIMDLTQFLGFYIALSDTDHTG